MILGVSLRLKRDQTGEKRGVLELRRGDQKKLWPFSSLGGKGRREGPRREKRGGTSPDTGKLVSQL